MDIKTGYFTGASAYQSVILGFVPDQLDVHALGSAQVSIHWDGGVCDALAESLTNPAFGFAEMGVNKFVEDGDSYVATFSGASNVYELAIGVATHGISAMNRSDERYMIEHPDGTGKKPCLAYQWGADSIFASTAVQATPRSISNIGTLMVPETVGKRQYVFELSTMNGDSKTSATEPTWSLTEGAVQDDDSCFWIARNAEVVRYGGKGFNLGNSVLTDGDLVVFTAVRTDQNKYIGDSFDTGEVYLN